MQSRGGAVSQQQRGVQRPRPAPLPPATEPPSEHAQPGRALARSESPAAGFHGPGFPGGARAFRVSGGELAAGGQPLAGVVPAEEILSFSWKNDEGVRFWAKLGKEPILKKKVSATSFSFRDR